MSRRLGASHTAAAAIGPWWRHSWGRALALALLSIAVGLALGQHLITFWNASLL